MHKLLLVEDNELNRDMLSRRLERRGYIIEMAADGEKALQKVLDSEDIHLVLLDMDLPVKDGWTVTREIRSNPTLSHIPIIALTAYAMAGDREKALQEGCDEYETKPIEFDRLVGKIERLLETK